MINEYYAKQFCKEDISKIENYELAINDKSQTWHCHHRRETIYSKTDLIEISEYYNRPAIELIFLTPSEHKALHNTLFFKGRKFSLKRNHKVAESHKGKTHSEAAKRKISETMKGKKRGPYKKKSVKHQSS